MLPWDLEDWLTEVGSALVEKSARQGSLNPCEELVYEIWLLDTEVRNGGVSQYFCNWGIERWTRLCALAEPAIPAFRAFAEQVRTVIKDSEDPYSPIIESRQADEAYMAHQTTIVTKLRERARDMDAEKRPT